MLAFVKMRQEHMSQVLKWRTSPEVTRYMFTDVDYDMEKQQQWFARISESASDLYWMISLNDEYIGVLSLNDIRPAHRRCSWAFYIGEPNRRIIGGMVAPYVYRYVFEVMNFKKIIGEVMEGNDNVRNMHVLQGCREVGVYRDHIYKYGRYHDVYLYEMTDLDWEQRKEQYKHCTAPFE